MKKILLLFISVVAFAACEYRGDCLCEYDVDGHHYIEHREIIIRDWDGSCRNIGYEDIHLDDCTFDLRCRSY